MQDNKIKENENEYEFDFKYGLESLIHSARVRMFNPPQAGQTKDLKINIEFVSLQHAAIGSKNETVIIN